MKQERLRLDRGGPMGRAVEQAVTLGLLVTATEIECNVWAATEAKTGWGSFCRHMAGRLPGMMIPSPGMGGAGWKCGGGPMTGTVVPLEHLDGLRQAREAARSVLPAGTALPWTVGAVARALLKWAVAPQSQEPYAESIMQAETGAEREFMYHDCTPGRYHYAAHWDLRSCFYELMRRLPCLRLSIDGEGLHWGAYTGTEAERLDAVLRAVEGSHRLRNSLWGVCLGSKKKGLAYTSAAPKKGHHDWAWWAPGKVRVIRPPGRLGPARPAALLVARTASELCQLESLASGSVYSTVDCVTIPGRDGPVVWPQVGLPYRKKREGVTHIVGRRVYRFGGKRSEPYEAVLRLPKERRRFTCRPVGKADPPDRLFFREWL